jgi:hypothetical protein
MKIPEQGERWHEEEEREARKRKAAGHRTGRGPEKRHGAAIIDRLCPVANMGHPLRMPVATGKVITNQPTQVLPVVRSA